MITSRKFHWNAFTGFPLFYWQKNPGLSRTPMNNFPGPFRGPRMFKYKEKTAFTYNIQSVVHCRKFSMKQNVDVSCSEFRWTYLHMVSTVYTCSDCRSSLEKCMTFKDIFPGLSRTLSFIFQDFPGPGIFKKKIQGCPGLSGNSAFSILTKR